MRNRGLSRPGLNMGICVAGVVLPALSIWSGVAEMNALGHETSSSAARIGIAIPIGVICFFMFFNFLWGYRLIAAARRGEGVIGRWTVLPAELEAFRADEESRLRRDNDWKMPKKAPPEGIEVIFTENGLLIGGTYFGLVTTGMFRFEGVQMLPGNPLALEFGTVMTSVTNTTTVRFYRTRGVLRVPVSRAGRDAAVKVLNHYAAVDQRKVLVNPSFYARRIRWGLIGAVVFFLIAAGGFGLNAAKADLGDIPLYMAVVGTVTGIGGLVLAFTAWTLHMKQRRPR
jgi:hypothetical protein